MDSAKMPFTAVYFRNDSGYVGFIEEMPTLTSQGRTLDEARETLRRITVVVFEEERRGSAQMLAGKKVVREPFILPLPRPR
jgi:predicted RNase H-like HicB family nuclease